MKTYGLEVQQPKSQPAKKPVEVIPTEANTAQSAKGKQLKSKK